MNRTVIAVTGIDPQQKSSIGIGIARSLRMSPRSFHIIGLAHDPQDAGMFMDWLLDDTHLIPDPGESAEFCLESLLDLQKRLHINVLIPGDQKTWWFYMKHAAVLQDAGIRTMLPHVIDSGWCKIEELEEVACILDVNLPETVLVRSSEEIKGAFQQIGFPMIVKASQLESIRCNTRFEALAAIEKLASQGANPIAIQQVIEGEGFSVAGLGDGRGGLPAP